VSKPKLEWAEKGEVEDFDAAVKFLSLLCSGTKASAHVKSLRNAKLVEHAAKDLLRAAHLPLLPSDESHVDADLKRIHKGKALAPVLLVRGDIAAGLPLIVADGYHRICATRARQSPAELPTSIIDAHNAAKVRFGLGYCPLALLRRSELVPPRAAFSWRDCRCRHRCLLPG
jgi:hypothetical protein